MEKIENIKVELDGVAFGRIYKFDDDKYSVYFEGLKVDSDFQKQGYGNKILKMLESFGKSLGATKSYLWVNEYTWMCDWYKRNGYVYLRNYEEKNYIWLVKTL